MHAQIVAIHPVLMVRDVAAAIQFYAQLGFALAFSDSQEQPRYAGLRRDQVEIHVQWHDPSAWAYPIDRPTYRFFVHDVDALYAEFCASMPAFNGTRVGDTPWGTREFHLQDPDRNGLQFYRNR